MAVFTPTKGSWGAWALIEPMPNTKKISCSMCKFYNEDRSCAYDARIFVPDVRYDYWRYCGGFLLSDDFDNDLMEERVNKRKGVKSPYANGNEELLYKLVSLHKRHHMSTNTHKLVDTFKIAGNCTHILDTDDKAKRFRLPLNTCVCVESLQYKKICNKCVNYNERISIHADKKQHKQTNHTMEEPIVHKTPTKLTATFAEQYYSCSDNPVDTKPQMQGDQSKVTILTLPNKNTLTTSSVKAVSTVQEIVKSESSANAVVESNNVTKQTELPIERRLIVMNSADDSRKEFDSFFESRSFQNTVKKNYVMIGYITIDYYIETGKVPLLVFYVDGNDSAYRTSISCLLLKQRGIRYRSLIIHNTFDKLEEFIKHVIIDVSDKQFSTVKSFIYGGEEYISGEIK